MISTEGDQLPTGDGGMVIVSWAPPHFFTGEKLFVLYFGEKPRVLDTLERLMGPPFAGGKGD